MIKVLIIVGFFSLAVAYHEIHVRKEFAEAWEKMCEPFQKECIQESGVKEELIKNMVERGIYSDERAFKCYLGCLHKRLEFVDENGSYKKDNIYKKVKGADFKIIEDSLDKIRDENDACEKAYLLVTSVRQKISKKFPLEDDD